jgi:hypothetical protein
MLDKPTLVIVDVQRHSMTRHGETGTTDHCGSTTGEDVGQPRIAEVVSTDEAIARLG